MTITEPTPATATATTMPPNTTTTTKTTMKPQAHTRTTPATRARRSDSHCHAAVTPATSRPATPAPAAAAQPAPDLQKLMERAAKAQPPARTRRSKYSHLLPVAERLLAGGFSLKDAVSWLIQERQVPATRRDSAYSTLRQALTKTKGRPETDPQADAQPHEQGQAQTQTQAQAQVEPLSWNGAD